MKYTVKKTFKGSPNGIDVFDFRVGEDVNSAELGPELEKIAQHEGWIEASDAEAEQKPATAAKSQPSKAKK